VDLRLGEVDPRNWFWVGVVRKRSFVVGGGRRREGKVKYL